MIKRKLTAFLYIFGIQYITAKTCIVLVKMILCLERYNSCSLINQALLLLSINNRCYYHPGLINDSQDLVFL